MVKKISYLLLSVSILAIGYIAFNKLNYWDRSVRIFNIIGRNQVYEGRRGRDAGRSEGFSDREGRRDFEMPEGLQEGSQRSGMRNLPDSIRERIESAGGRQSRMDRNAPDSLRQQLRRNNRELAGRTQLDRGSRNGDRRGRGGFYRGRKIYLRNVLWFTAVFAAATVVIIYMDKACCFFRKRKKSRSALIQNQNQKEII